MLCPASFSGGFLTGEAFISGFFSSSEADFDSNFTTSTPGSVAASFKVLVADAPLNLSSTFFSEFLLFELSSRVGEMAEENAFFADVATSTCRVDGEAESAFLKEAELKFNEVASASTDKASTASVASVTSVSADGAMGILVASVIAASSVSVGS